LPKPLPTLEALRRAGVEIEDDGLRLLKRRGR